MCDKMEFPKTFKEFAEYYGFKDEKWAYTNNAELIPVFRVEQWLDHINAKTQMIDKSNFDERQYKADLDTAYECGRASVLKNITQEINQLGSIELENGNGTKDEFIRKDYVLEIIDQAIKECDTNE